MSEVKIKLIKCINIVKLVDEIDMNTRLINSLFDSFDFVSAAKKNFFCDPNLIRKANGKYLYKLYYDESSKNELDYAMKQWVCKGMKKSDILNNNLTLNKIKNMLPDSQYLYNIGKFYHQINMKVMKRSFLIKDQPIT